jgi:hypothetical protein
LVAQDGDQWRAVGELFASRAQHPRTGIERAARLGDHHRGASARGRATTLPHLSIIGVIVFVGLIAYDTQRIKEMYLESDSKEVAGKKRSWARWLYLVFINLFMLPLQLFGQGRQE